MQLRLRFGQRFTLLLLAAMLLTGASVADAQELATAASPEEATRIERILLVLAKTQEQEAGLDSLLAAQQTPGDAQFHKWLTPAEYASRFAPAVRNTAAVASWLTKQGFDVAALPASRGWVEFSGTKAQVESAFGAHLVEYDSRVDGVPRFKFSSTVVFTPAIAPYVQGFASLDGAAAVSATTSAVPANSPIGTSEAQIPVGAVSVLTSSAVRNAIGLRATADRENGAGQTIAFPSRSNVRQQDLVAFRKSLKLPEVQISVRLDGADPGRTGDEASAIAALAWASVVAPAANLTLAPADTTNATDGVDLAIAATVDRWLASTVSIGYTSCESGISAGHQALYASLYRQAAAEGMAIIVASGDSGAAACHLSTDREPIAIGPSVNAIASTPWNTAVGAIAFDSEAPTNATTSLTVWQASNPALFEYATGGGVSGLYATPVWQAAAGVPESDPGTNSSHHRYLPDLSLPATASDSLGLPFCFSGDSGESGCRWMRGGGSAISAAMFSGVSAILAQEYGPQGNLAPNLYALKRRDTSASAAASADAFRSSNGKSPASDQAEPNFVDITKGNAKLPCVSGSEGCVSGLIGFTSAEDYDLASGLGSIHGEALIANWAKPDDIGTAPVTITMTTVGGTTYNPSATIVLAAKVISGSGSSVPTGTVQFYDETVGANTGTPVTLTADGTASYSETGQFTDGSHSIAAIYSGDSTYQTAESEPITFNIQPSATSLTVTPSTTTPTGGATITVTGTVTSANPGATAPTGLLTVNLDGIAQGTGTFKTTGTTTSATVSVTIPASGSHAIQGTYAGDTNYESSTSPSVTVSVSKVATTTTLTASPTTITTGVNETLTAIVAPAMAVTGTTYTLTGTVSFYDGTTLLGTVIVGSNTAVLTGVALSASTSHTVTAVYSGDATYSTSTSTAVTLASNLLPVTVTLTESTMILSPGQAVTLNAVVTPVNTPPTTAEQHPSGYILWYANGVLVGAQSPVLEGSGYSSVASTFVSSLAAGSYVITAAYSGDPTYAAATSNSVSLQVEDFTLTCSSTNITMVQGTTQSVPCTVAALGGLTGSIQVVCEEQNPPTTGAISCSFNPSVLLNGGATTLTVITTAGNVAENRTGGQPGQRGSPPWKAAGGGLALAFAGLLLSPIGRRAKWLKSSRLLALAFLLGGLASAGLGCSNSSTLVTNTGTPLGEHTLKLTAASAVGTVTVSHYAYLTVNVTPPTTN